MIVKMKEISLFTLSSSIDSTVRELGKMGLVELREVKLPEEKSYRHLTQQISDAEKALAHLKNFIESTKIKTSAINPDTDDPKRLVDRILISIDFKKKCFEIIEDLNAQEKWYEIWGKTMNKDDIDFLNEHGIFVWLYRVNTSSIQTIKEDECLMTFAEIDNKVPIALFSQKESSKWDLEEDTPPRLQYSDLRRQQLRKNRQLEQVDVFLTEQIKNLGLIEDYLEYLNDQLKTKKALGSMGEIDGQVNYIKGYIPATSIEKFKTEAEKNDWGFEISEPKNIDDVPVYIKNPKWINIINPVMKFIDIVPGYKEVDVSIYFLVAFALF